MDSELGERNYRAWRNSFRIKFRSLPTELIVLEGTGFFQPSLSSMKDYVVTSTTTVAVKIKKWLSLTSALTYNSVSLTGRENLLLTYGIALESYF